MNNLITLPDQFPIKLTETGLIAEPDATEDAWRRVGEALARIERGTQWLIGDWYNQIPWGDKQAACERVGINPKTARNYAVVANTIPMSRRRDISFGHHEVVAALPEEDQDELLDEAVREGLSVRKLKEAKANLEGANALPATTPRDAGSTTDAATHCAGSLAEETPTQDESHTDQSPTGNAGDLEGLGNQAGGRVRSDDAPRTETSQEQARDTPDMPHIAPTPEVSPPPTNLMSRPPAQASVQQEAPTSIAQQDADSQKQLIEELEAENRALRAQLTEPIRHPHISAAEFLQSLPKDERTMEPEQLLEAARRVGVLSSHPPTKATCAQWRLALTHQAPVDDQEPSDSARRDAA